MCNSFIFQLIIEQFPMTDYLEIDIDVFCFKIKIQLTGNSIVVCYNQNLYELIHRLVPSQASTLTGRSWPTA